VSDFEMTIEDWEGYIRDYLNYPEDKELPAAAKYVARQIKKEHERDEEREDSAEVSGKSASDLSISYGDTGYYDADTGLPKKFLPILRKYRKAVFK